MGGRQRGSSRARVNTGRKPGVATNSVEVEGSSNPAAATSPAQQSMPTASSTKAASSGFEPGPSEDQSAISDPQSSSRPQVVGEPKRTLAQLAVLAMLIGIALIGGFQLKPTDDQPKPLAASVMEVQVPVSIQGDYGLAQLNSVVWTEARGEKIPGYESFPWATQISDPAKDTTRIVMMAQYVTNWANGAKWNGAFDLPDGAKLEQCIAPPGFTCLESPSNAPMDQGRSKNVVSIGGAFPHFPPNSQDPGNGTNGIVVVADISGLPGMTMSRSHTRTTIQPPTVYPYLPPDISQADRGPVTVVEQALFKRAADMTWSMAPALSGANNGVNMNGFHKQLPVGDVATWAYQMSGPSPLATPPITGTDESAINDDATHLFWSGIIFGVAGAAVITFVQIAVVGWRHPRSWFGRKRRV
jgi:hypothetical protein